MKHSGFRIEIETDEHGYSVQRSKHLFTWADRMIWTNLQAEFDKWIKGKDKTIITIMGTGIGDNYNKDEKKKN